MRPPTCGVTVTASKAALRPISSRYRGTSCAAAFTTETSGNGIAGAACTLPLLHASVAPSASAVAANIRFRLRNVFIPTLFCSFIAILILRVARFVLCRSREKRHHSTYVGGAGIGQRGLRGINARELAMQLWASTDLLESTCPRRDELGDRAVQQKRCLAIGITFEDRHHERKALERRQRDNRRHLFIESPHVGRDRYVDWAGMLSEPSPVRGLVILCCQLRTRMDHPDRTRDNRAPGPGLCPILEDHAAGLRILQSRDKTLLCGCVIGRQQKREQIQAVHIALENPAEVCTGCVRCGVVMCRLMCDVICPEHLQLLLNWLSFEPSENRQSIFIGPLFVAPFCRPIVFRPTPHCALHRHRRASCFRTCLVKTPSQANFAPSFISLNSVFSPSALMTVTSLRSMTNLRPLSCSPALRQALSTSAVHGGTSLPCKTSLRWP